jgi:hypothetical protein
MRLLTETDKGESGWRRDGDPLKRHGRFVGEGEHLVLEVHRHPAVLLRSFLVTVGATIGALWLSTAINRVTGVDFVTTLAAIVIVVFVLRFLWHSLEWWATQIVVTDRRIFQVWGVLTRKVASMPLEKVTDMTYRRTLWGRLLGYGDLLVDTPGQELGLSYMDHLPNPDFFYRTVTSLVTGAVALDPDPDPIADDDDVAAFDAVFEESDDQDTGPLPRVKI